MTRWIVAHVRCAKLGTESFQNASVSSLRSMCPDQARYIHVTAQRGSVILEVENVPCQRHLPGLWRFEVRTVAQTPSR